MFVLAANQDPVGWGLRHGGREMSYSPCSPTRLSVVASQLLSREKCAYEGRELFVDQELFSSSHVQSDLIRGAHSTKSAFRNIRL
jgi:hypothetical protein